MEQLKTCSKCDQSLPISAFCKSRKSRDGIATECKQCKKKRFSAWLQTNREYNKSRKQEWANSNPDKVKSYTASYYLAHSEEMSKKHKKWAKENPEKVKAYTDYYQKANADRLRAKSAAYLLENRDEINTRKRARYHLDPEAERARRKQWNAKHPGHQAAYCAAWYKSNPERARAIARAWNKAHPEYVWAKNHSEHSLASKRKYSSESREKLTDVYVARLIKYGLPISIPKDTIPQELIKLKRLQLQIKRKLKELKK